MTSQQNDIFAAVIQKPNASVFDLAASDIVPTNTQLLSPEEYKKLPKVQQMFKTSTGKFDNDAFNLVYNRAAQLYQNLGSDKSLADALEYDPEDLSAPIHSKKIDVRPVAMMDINPFKKSYSLTGVNSIDDNGLSLRELAQQSKIFDTRTGKWMDKSANDLNIFDANFGDTLVYAQWDTDGVSLDPVTGKTVKHKKGEWKYNKDGNLYIETLGDREVYGKQIVNPMDILTKEGTFLNSIDFFDSDGKNKSKFGTAMKFAASIAPYLIPGFNVWYGGIQAAIGLSAVLPTFYKAAEGIFTGDVEAGNETGMWKAMNEAEGYMAKFNARSTSDEGSQGLMNFEQLGSMVSDVFSQIYEQRAAASVSKLFFKSKDAKYLEKLSTIAAKEVSTTGVALDDAKAIASRAIERSLASQSAASRQSTVAKALNLGYMALTQSADVYSDALAGGYDRRTAGLATLAAAASQYGLMMNNRMGDWFLDKSVGYSEDFSKAGALKAIRKEYKPLAEAVEAFAVDPVAAKKEVGNIFTRVKNKLRDTITEPLSESALTENLLKRSLIEGVEEVTEQGAIDAVKGITDALSYFGVGNKKASFGGWSTVFSQEGLQNYVANFIGGAIGGPMFELEHSVISPLISTGKIAPDVQHDIHDFVVAGKAGELRSMIDKEKKRWGSTTLSPVATEINGEKVYLPTENISQADMIAMQMNRHIDQIEKIVTLEKLGDSDEEIIRKSIMNDIYIKDMKKSNVDRFVLSDIRDVSRDIVALSTDIASLQASKTDANKEEVEKGISELKSKLDEKRQEYTDLTQGTKEDYHNGLSLGEYYHGLSLFALNPILHTPYISLNVDEYVKDKYGKDYYALEADEKLKLDAEFKDVMSDSETNFKNKMKMMYNSFLAMNEEMSKSLVDYDKDGYASVKSSFYDTLRDPKKFNFYKSLERLNQVNRSLRGEGFDTHTLDSDTDLSIGKFLVESGYIENQASGLDEDIANTKKLMKYAELLGLSQEDGESDEDYGKRIVPQINQVIDDYRTKSSVFEMFPELEGKNTHEIYKAINNSNLSPEQKDKLMQAFPEAYSVMVDQSLWNDINNSGKEITAEDLAQFGVVTDPSDTQDIINAKFAKIQSDIQDRFKNAMNSISTVQQSDDVLRIEKEFNEDLDKAKVSSDESNQAIAQIIDSIGLPTTDFNINVLNDQINAKVSENKERFRKERERINSLPDSEEKKQALNMLNYTEASMPNFKIKDSVIKENPTISVREALILKYARDLQSSGGAIDAEAKKELEDVASRLEDKSFNASDNGDYELAEEYSAKSNEIKEIVDSLEVKTNSLYDKLREFEINLYG